MRIARHNSGKRWGMALAVAAWAWAAGIAQAQVLPITSATVTYQTYSNTNDNYSTTGGGSAGFPTGTVYNVRFNEGVSNQMFLGEVTVGGRMFDGVALAGDINIARATNATIKGEHHIVLYEQSSFSGTNVFLKSSYAATMEESLRSRLINHGADNVFSDVGDGNGNNNNIQRIDYLFPDGLPVHSHVEQRGFLVMDRGGNDRFKIAAVTGVDGNGKPTAFGTPVSVLETNWGASGVSLDTIVMRGYTESGDPQHPSADVSPQPLSGVFLNWQTLGLRTNDLFYGYALVGNDTTTNGALWGDVQNSVNFPTNTSPESTFGGLDLISGGLMFYDEALNVTLGDRAWDDLDADGIQDAGESGATNVLVYVYDGSSNLAAIVRTDTNGFWRSPGHGVGSYYVKYFLPTGYEYSARYVGTNAAIDSDADLVTGRTATFALTNGQTNLTLDAGMYRRATLGDFTWEDANGNGQQDGGEPALSNVVVRLYNAASNVVGTTTSSVAGAYVFTNLLPGAYFVGFTPPAGYLFTTSNVGADATDSDPLPGTNRTALVALVSGQTESTVDAGFYRPASLGDFTWVDANGNGQQDGGEPALASVVVTLYNAATNAMGVTTSSLAGAYAFANLAPGAYAVGFTPPAGYLFTTSNVGADATDSDPLPGTNRTAFVVLTNGQTDLSVDAGFIQPASIGNYTWQDGNFNGQQDGGESALSNVVVRLYDAASNVVGMTTSSAAGLYVFTNLPPGTYFVGFTPPAGYSFTLANAGADATDSDADPATGLTGLFALTSGQADLSVDAGFYNPANVSLKLFKSSSLSGNWDFGATNDYYLTLQNTGTVALAGIALTDVLPPGATFVAGSAQIVKLVAVTTNPFVETVSDGFGTASYANNNGTTNWVGSWNEIGDNASAASGDVLVRVAGGTNALVFENTGADNDHVTRTNALTPRAGRTYTNMSLAFSYRRQNWDAGDSFTLYVSTNGFVGQSNLVFAVPTTAGTDAAYVQVATNLASRMGANVALRLRAGAAFDASDRINFDFLTFTNSGYDVATNTVATYSAGVAVTAVSNLAAATPANLLSNYTLSAGSSVTVRIQATLGAPLVSTQLVNTAAATNPVTPPLYASVTNVSVANAVGDRVWNDANANGIQDAGEAGVTGVTVRIYSAASNLLATTTSGADGAYSFTNLPTGAYFLEFAAPGYYATAQDQGGNDALDSDIDGAGRTAVFALSGGANDTSRDAGGYLPASLGDFTWGDGNFNGQQDGGEPALSNVVVTLYNAASNVMGVTTSSAVGAYAFANLVPGEYFLAFAPPAGYLFTTANAGDDATDSDPLAGTNRTALIALVSGQNDLTVDAGFFPPATLGDYTWVDANYNGQQDGGEPGLSNVVVTLYNAASNVIGVTTSSVAGAYAFANLPPGSYFVGFGPPAGYLFTAANAGDDATDSDPLAGTNRTALVGLTNGQTDATVDAGFVQPASIGDYAWVDTNGNGQQDGGEPGLSNVVVTLYNAASNVIGVTTSSVAGAYAFTSLVPGTYVVGFAPPAGYVFTTANAGADATDSDADAATGLTGSYALTNGQAEATADAGFYNPANVDLKLFKSTSLSTNWNFGVTNDYYLTLANTGTVSLTGVALTDALPPGVTFVTGSAAIVQLLAVTTNPFAETVSDGFGTVSYANNDGTTNWVGSWGESGDNASAASGSVLVRVAGGTNALVFENTDADNDYVTRTNALAAAAGKIYTNLTLGFAYRRENWDAGDSFTCYVSTNGFVGQSNLVFAAPTTAGTDASYVNVQISTNVTALLGAQMALRWRAGGSFGAGDRINFDFVTFTSSGNVVSTNAVWTYEPGVTVAVVSNMAAATPANLLSNYTLPAGSNVTVRIQATLDVPLVATQFVNTAMATNPATPPVRASVTNVSVANAVGDRAWLDADGNGIQDTGEPGLEGMAVRLYDAGSNLVAATTSGVAGAYGFTDLPSGSYFLEFDPPTNHVATAQDQGGNDALDSDVDAAGRTAPFALSGGMNDTSRDAGFYQPSSSIGDLVWRDLNVDGLQSGGSETGMPGVVVRLYDGSSNLVATTTSLVTGAYGFTGIPTATYFLEFAAPTDFNFTLRNQGGDDALDSDVAPATGRTAPFFLPAGTNDLRWDAGLVEIVYGLQLTKTSDAGSCLSPGDAITYTLTVANTGNVTQAGIAVEDFLPPGLTYVADSAQVVVSNTAVRTVRDEFNAVSYAGQDGTENWAVDWQENDPYGTVGPVGNYVGVTGNRLTITYAYVGDETAWRWADLSAETNATLSFDWETVGLDANEYLDVQIATSPEGPFTQLQAFGGTASGTASYDVTAYISTSTTIRIQATPGTENWESGESGYLDDVEFSSIRPDIATNPASAPPGLLSGLTLTAGGTLTATFQATVDSPGTVSQLVNVATASSPRQPEIEASVTNCVVTADVGVQKAVTDATPDMRQVIEYTVVASNNGPAVATGVVLTDVLPAQVEYNSHANGAYSVGSGEWTIGTLAVNASTSIIFNVTVREYTAGFHITNVATVTGRDLFDPVPDNDTDSVVIVPKPGVNIGNRIWFDANRDGIQNTGETNVFADIPVALLDANGNMRASMSTDSAGNYLFTNMPPGTYLVRFDLTSISTNEALSTAKAGGDDEIDSDAIAGSVGDFAWTAEFSVTNGQTTQAIDLGITTRGSTRAEVAAMWGEWTGGRGVVAWRTASEFGTAGFFVFRVDPETGAETRLSDILLPSAFQEDGSTYRLVDPEAREGETGSYRLDEVELTGAILGLPAQSIRFVAPPPAAQTTRPVSKSVPAMKVLPKAAGPSSVLKVLVKQEGIYGVSLPSIAGGMGLSLEAVQALAETDSLKIMAQGRPVPAIIDAARERLLFHAPAPARNWYSHEAAYLISAGEGQAMPRRAPLAAAGASVFPVQIHFEQDQFLFAMTQMPEDFYFWAGVISQTNDFLAPRFPLDLEGYAGGDVRLKVRLMGWSSTADDPDHLAEFAFNGTGIGSITFDDQETAEAELTVPAALVSSGENTLTVNGVLQPGHSHSFFVVDWIEASFDRELAPLAIAAAFRANGAESVSAAAFAAPLALALDKDGNPTWIADENGELPSKAWAVSAADDRFAVIEAAAVSMVDPEPAAADAWFLSRTNRIDYLVIASRALAPAAQELADYRAAQGLRAGVATFEDVCDLMAGGVRTPEAIPELLSYAAATWARPPQMVVLAGNGHYDYLGANTSEANHLPPMLVQTPSGVCASDALLADAGGDDLPDVAIGRLPALTPADLSAMIAKIQAYEAGFGAEWQNQLVLVSDKADSAGDFRAANARLGQLATGPYSIAERIELDTLALSAARAKLMSRFKSGAGFIHYTGHGGHHNLSARNLLTEADVGAMTNAERPAITVALSCLAGRYEVPATSSLGEALMRHAQGGAVAVLGPSGLSRNEPATDLGEAFYRAVLQEGTGRLGLAFLQARRAMASTLFTGETLEVYNLLGDPALRLAGNEVAIEPPAPAQVFLQDLAQTFDGTPKSALATTEPAGLAVEITYDGDFAPPTEVGTYAVVATVYDANYEGFATGTLVVAKAAAAVALGDLAQVYDGAPKSATATTEPAGLAVEITYDGLTNAPVAAGAYAVVAAICDAKHEGTVSGTLVVAKATAGVTLEDLVQVYDGNPKHASVTTMPAGLTVDVTYEGSPTPPTAAGTYAVVAAVTEPNHAGAATGGLVIGKANQTLAFPAIGDLFTTDTVGLSATASSGLPVAFAVVDGPAVISAGTNLSFTGAGPVTIQASQGGDANWNAATGVFRSFQVMSPVVISSTHVNVRETGAGRFFVKLARAPAVPLTVTVARVAGDANLAVAGGAELAFTPANWRGWQMVTLAAAPDGNASDETAAFQVSAPGVPGQLVAATALDGDIGENLAAPARGTTLAGTRAFQLAAAVDGVHAVSANYAFTIWTNLQQPGSITMDLQDATDVARVRVLNYDWSLRSHQYRIDASLDGIDWTVLVDAAAGEHSGWEDWVVTNQSWRYLRFVGLSNSVNSSVCIPEWEVYGPPALFQAPRPELSAPGVNVREKGEGRFFVRLSGAPAESMTVRVSRASGDANLAVSGGAELTFKPSNWRVWQAVTVTAGEDANGANEMATFRISAPGTADRFVRATALDDDIGENLALASGGTTVAGAKAYRMSEAIDGVHADATNYAFLVWTNLQQPGTLTVDLQGTATVSRVRVLNYDRSPRAHQYRVESSADGTVWKLLADASSGEHFGWEDWAVASAPMRFVRFTALSNSVNSTVCIPELEIYGARAALSTPMPEVSATNVNVREAGDGRFFVRLEQAPTGTATVGVSRVAGDAGLTVASGAVLTFEPSNWNAWQPVTLAAAADGNGTDETATFRVSTSGTAERFVQATALDVDIGENLALASGGATISGKKAFRPMQAIDGVHASSTNYAYTIWTNEQPGELTLDLGAAMVVTRVRVLNYDWSLRLHQYRIESSEDGATWSLLADAGVGEHRGWEDWAADGRSARYLRLTGLSNSANSAVCIAEWEVYGAPAAAKAALRAAAAAVPLQADPFPLTVVTSDDGPEHTNGWAAVDGDTNTVWEGRADAGGWHIAVGYDATLALTNLVVDVAEGSAAVVQCLYSLDGKDWREWPEDAAANPVKANYLWLLFPGEDGDAPAPQVIEITPQQ